MITTINEFKKQSSLNEGRRTTEVEQEVMIYLNDLRDSGQTNMFGAVPYILDNFSDIELNKQEASRILSLWMKNFNEDGNYSEVNENLTGLLPKNLGSFSRPTDILKIQGFDTKDTQRIEDIVTRSKGNQAKVLSLAANMAKSITSISKAKKRANAATNANLTDVADIFIDRALNLFYGR